MKKIYIVFSTTKNGKHHATAETIQTGENLMNFIERYAPDIAHICETATEAANTAQAWNEAYKSNGTNLY